MTVRLGKGEDIYEALKLNTLGAVVASAGTEDVSDTLAQSVYTIMLTGQTANVTTTNIPGTNIPGIYALYTYSYTDKADPVGAGLVRATVRWNDVVPRTKEGETQLYSLGETGLSGCTTAIVCNGYITYEFAVEAETYPAVKPASYGSASFALFIHVVRLMTFTNPYYTEAGAGVSSVSMYGAVVKLP